MLIESSLVSLALGLMGPPVLIGLAVLWVSTGASLWFAAVGAAGFAALLVVLFDMPVAAVFSTEGVLRRSPLRDQSFDWAEIEDIHFTKARSAPSLVARVRGRRYLLADRPGLDPSELELVLRLRPDT